MRCGVSPTDSSRSNGEGARVSARHGRFPTKEVCRFVIVFIGGVVLILAALWFGPVRWAREAAIAVNSMCPLNQLELAMHNYHDSYGCFPPAYVADESGKPMHSWRVLILPFVEQRELYQQYDFQEPWNGANNRKLADRMPHIFHCPSEPESSTYTNFVVIRGPGTAFPGAESTSLADFRDGVAETILIAEIASSSICWLEPRDLDVRRMSFSVNDPSRPSISSSRRRGPYVVFADSIHCHRLSESLAPEALRALTTIAGQEPMCVAEIDGVGLTSPMTGPATDAALKQWNEREGLRALWLSRSPVTDAVLADLPRDPDLDTLHLRGTRITDEGLREFRGRTGFYALDLSGTEVTDAGLDHLAGLGGVYLCLADTQVTTAGVVRLLESVPEASIGFSLGGIQRGYLHFPGSSATDADVLLCRGLTGLTSVDLSRTKITDASLPVLGGLPELWGLHLDGTAITDAGLEHLTGLEKLSYLWLDETPITDAGLEHVAKLTSLTSLQLANTEITDAGIEHLQHLSGLWRLDLSGTAVTDEGAEHLGRLPALFDLKLNGTQVSDSGLEHLEQLPDLRSLELRGTRVSAEGIQKMEEALPHVEIVW